MGHQLRCQVKSLQRTGSKSKINIPSPRRLTVLLTFQCNLTCRHCLFGCGPSQTECLSTPQAKYLIDQACSVSTIEAISFSGGEPFILGKELDEVVRYASRAGFATECVTNCYWAKSETAAHKRLARLKDAGLSVLSISADDFHQEQLPFTSVRNAYWAARAFGLRVALITSTSKSSRLRGLEIRERIGDDDIHSSKRKAPRDQLPQAVAIESSFIPVGRGESIPIEEREFANHLSPGPCRSIFRDLLALPSGQLLPCCSAAAIRHCASSGNLFETSLLHLLSRISANPLFLVIATEGPVGLREKLGSGADRRYSSECHLCHELLSDPNVDSSR